MSREPIAIFQAGETVGLGRVQAVHGIIGLCCPAGDIYSEMINLEARAGDCAGTLRKGLLGTTLRYPYEVRKAEKSAAARLSRSGYRGLWMLRRK
jgi:hypothetical protein